MNQSSKGVDTAIQIALVALLALWCFQIAKPFIAPIVWAGIIAIAVYPLQKIIMNKVGFSNGWSATLLTLIMLVVMIGPTVMLTEALIDNSRTIAQHIKNDDINIPPPAESVGDWPLIGKQVESIWQDLATDHKTVLGNYAPQIKKAVNWLLAAVASTGLNILIFIFSIILAGVFVASAGGAKKAMESVFVRVAGGRGADLTRLSHDTVQSVVRGILGIAALQAVLAGLGFLAMGIPASGVLAVVCLILAVVQIDILIILIPLSIMAFTDPDTGTGVAIAFLVWNIAVGLMNNVLKPILLAKGVEAPMAVIFIGAIGGMMLSGIIGLFVGAVVMVLGYTLFMAWLDDAESQKEIQ